MASQERRTLSAFPAPPSFYMSFTMDNLSALKQLCNEDVDKVGRLSAAQASRELEHLIPPQPPGLEQSWYAFGEKRTLPPPDLPYLDSATLLLHAVPPTPASLVRLVRGALLAFLELAHVLASDPTPDRRFGTKWEDLRDLLLNAHRAVNLFRPWAARQQVLRSLRTHIANARAEIAAVERLERRVDALLLDLGNGGGGTGARGVEEDEEDEDEDGQDGQGKQDEMTVAAVSAAEGKEMTGVVRQTGGAGLADIAPNRCLEEQSSGSTAKTGNLTKSSEKTNWLLADRLGSD